ncbi:sensor histidine kinase [Paracraurococcus lichenis]|uniref:histidine kinase n=1 Tax=Paracraurococcus lichenis TaxID=3064888 RepID=A0ABT9EDA9_9PROT|nr:PAS domain S-box protein [Paracraurococcus sp. LOR1-02]MDO9714205.1 PAS domain S-box protein [Paracraurococcus sp. LOR1-02]
MGAVERVAVAPVRSDGDARPDGGRFSSLGRTGLGLQAHLLVFALAVLLPALTLGATTAWHLAGNYRRAFEARLADTARALALAMDSEVDRLGAALAALEASPDLARWDGEGAANLEAFHAQARTLAGQLGTNFALMAADGRQLLNAAVPPGAPLPGSNPAPEALRRVFETGRPFVRGLAVGPVAGSEVALLIVPVIRDGRVVVAATARLDPMRLSRLLEGQGFQGRAFATLADDKGRVVARSRELGRFLGRPAPAWFAPAIAGRKRGLVVGENLEGGRFLLAFERPRSAPDWAVVVAEPWESYRASWSDPLMQLGAGAAIALALTALLGSLLARRLVRPLAVLRRQAEQVTASRNDGAGSGLALAPATAVGVAEFDALFASLGQADAALRASEVRLRDLLATLDLGAFMACDLDGKIRFWSVGCERLYGWTAAEAVGHAAHDLLGTAFPLPRADIEATLQRDGEWNGDLRHRTRDGREVAAAVHKVLRRDAEGRPAGVLESVIDVTAQRQAEAALAESEARLRSVVKTAVDGILVADADGRIVSANPSAVRMFSYETAGELIGQNLSVLMPEREAERHREHLAAHHVTARSRAVGIPGRELVVRRRDGTEFPIDLSVTSFQVRGQRFFTGIVRDATDWAQAEQRRKLLVAELNHRVKNTLATVQSVAVQTLRGADGDVARFVRDFSSRLQALAVAHDLLTAHAWQDTDLATVVRAALAPWMGGDSQRIIPAGPEGAVPLRPLQAQAVVLALHELVTNAAKHGALSRAGGRVELRWTERQSDGPVQVKWVEAGGPRLAGPPIRRGFGIRLLERAIAQDLGPGAQVELHFEPEGLHAAFRFFPTLPDNRTAA